MSNKNVLTAYVKIQETINDLKKRIDNLDKQVTQELHDFFFKILENEEAKDNPISLQKVFRSGEKEKIFFKSGPHLNEE